MTTFNEQSYLERVSGLFALATNDTQNSEVSKETAETSKPTDQVYNAKLFKKDKIIKDQNNLLKEAVHEINRLKEELGKSNKSFQKVQEMNKKYEA